MCDYRQSQIPTQAVNDPQIINNYDADFDDKQENAWAMLLPVGSAFSRIGKKIFILKKCIFISNKIIL